MATDNWAKQNINHLLSPTVGLLNFFQGLTNHDNVTTANFPVREIGADVNCGVVDDAFIDMKNVGRER